MKKYLLLICIVAASHNLFGQTSTYNQAIGIKFPGGFAVTYKKFVTDANNVEGQAVFWRKGFRAVGLYEFNFAIEGAEGLNWFVGPGAHIGFWNNDFKNNYGSKADFGVDGIIGLDYKFRDYPVNISLDWQPSITLAGSTGFTPEIAGIGVRYTF